MGSNKEKKTELMYKTDKKNVAKRLRETTYPITMSTNWKN